MAVPSIKEIKKIDDPVELRRLLKELDFERFAADREAERLERENALYFVPKRPNPKQALVLDAFLNPRYKVFTYTGGNRSAKTTTCIWLALSVLYGRYLWDPSKILSFVHDKPRRVRIVGQDWEKHIKTVIEAKLEEWWPASRKVEKRKNNVGVYAHWKDVETGSTLEIMSNNQDSDLFEGWDGDLVYYDEPPKRDVRVACARGLVDREGKEAFGMTLLGEAWVSREVIKARLPDGSPDPSIFNVVATIYDNLGYGVTQAGIDQFEKTLTADEKEARLYGKPSYLSGLVWPQFDRNLHVKSRFDVPGDWLVDIQIDFHPAKPWAVQFLATDPMGFKFVVEEMWEKGNPNYIADQIVKRIKSRHYRVESEIQIDPLSKGDSNNDWTVFDTMAKHFASYGYMLGVGSKSKETGLAMVRELLMTENEMPALFFFNDCVKSIEHVEDYMFDPDTHKPSKENDDFCETLYRNVLRGTYWYPLRDIDEERRRPSKKRHSLAGY